MSKNPALGQHSLPGLTAREDMETRAFLRDPNHFMRRGIRIDKDTQDVGNTVVTKLRAGLTLVRVEAAGALLGKYVHATHASAPAAPDIVKAVILLEDINMLGKGGAVEDKMASGVFHGWVDEDALIFGTADIPTIDSIKGSLPLVEFE